MLLVPVLGLVSIAGVLVDDRAGRAQSAGRALTLMRAALAVETASAAFEQEIIPAFSAAIVRNPSLIGAVRNAPEIQAATAITQQLPQLRTATNAAMGALLGHSPLKLRAAALTSQLREVRAGIDTPVDLATALDNATGFLTALATQENAQVSLATKQGLGTGVVRAVRDVDVLARATQAAAREMAFFSATQFRTVGDPALLRQQWAQTWGEYAATSDAVAAQASPELAARWHAVDAEPSMRAFNEFLASQIVPTAPPLPMLQLISLILQDGARNHAYQSVLGIALTRAASASLSARQHANSDLLLILAVILLLVLLSVMVGVIVRRSVARPLSRLAAQATEISKGRLTDVVVGGPHEVRTVARALSSSVASLRTLQAQAAAVADGDLSSPVLQLALPGPLGEVVYSSVNRIISAINDRETAQNELAHRAAHDMLTELPNRTQALTLIEQALHRGQRNAALTALMFLDLDHFKSVNDHHGHASGDAVLQAVARRMQATVRDGDTVARLGGDEFVILIEHVDDEASIVTLAQRLIAEISTDIALPVGSVRVGASIGLAFCRDGYVNADRLLHEADSAAYRAKNSGRGRVDIFDDTLRAELRRRADVEQAIASGLANDEFVLHYQPVINLANDSIIGFEALIRWQRPGHGLISPDEFIPVAERSALINDIGRFALIQATRQLAIWQHHDPDSATMTMAVNISGRHLASTDIINDVLGALLDSRIAAHRLTLELTETVLVDDPVATRNLQLLREHGIKIAIDDFGTGFTSIGQIPRLPADTVKIDRSFIASLDPAHQELVRLIVTAAHAFGLTIIAEGIEHQYQADTLRAIHVEYGQGFLYARPQPPQHYYPQTDAATPAKEDLNNRP